MFCKNCGKEIPRESKFCQFCGKSIVSNDYSKKEEDEIEKKDIWDKFAEIYDSKDTERQRYLNLSSEEAWELINRLKKNSFEGFIEENKEQLNSQPYKVLEDLENTIRLAVMGGYWLWMSEYILKNGDGWKLKTIVLDDIIKDWTESLKGADAFIKNIPQDLDEAIGRYKNFVMNSFLENSPSVKELPVEFIEKIKLELLFKILWGYFIGISESKYIK